MRRVSLLLSVSIIAPLLLLAPSMQAAEFPDVSASDVKSMLDAKEKFLLVNALSDIEFKLEHIPGSINIPAGEIQTTDKLPQDKGALIVFY